MSTHVWIHPAFGAALGRRGLDTLEGLMAAGAQRSLTKRGLARWRERLVLEPDADLPRLYMKRYIRPPLLEQLRRWCAGARSTAENEWTWLRTLTALDIAVPEAVACAADRAWGRERCSVLVTAEIDGTSLERHAAGWAGSAGPAPALKRQLLRGVATIARRLHGAGLVHRDLYLAHLFCTLDTAEPGTLTLIDLQRVFRPRWRFERWRCKDLAALNYSTPVALVTRTDRLRWYRWYAGRERMTPADRRLLRRVALKTRRIARHSRKHGLG